MKRGPFEVTDSKIIYKNPWMEVREDKVIRPNGEKGIFGIIDAEPGSVMLALTKDDYVHLAKEFRYAHNELTYELPGGTVDKSESPLAAAKRELKEELGLTAKKWTSLGTVSPFTTIMKTVVNLFLAEDLVEGEATDPEKELIEVVKKPFGEVLNMISTGEIVHTESIVAILKVAKMKGF